MQLEQEEIAAVETEQLEKINESRVRAGKVAAENVGEFTETEFKNYEELVDYHLPRAEQRKVDKYKPIYDKAFKDIAYKHRTKRGFTATGVDDFNAEYLQMYEDAVRAGLERSERKYR